MTETEDRPKRDRKFRNTSSDDEKERGSIEIGWFNRSIDIVASSGTFRFAIFAGLVGVAAWRLPDEDVKWLFATALVAFAMFLLANQRTSKL